MLEYEYRIDGYPVTKQEVLGQAEMISGKGARSLATARRILEDDGREVTAL